MRRFFLLFFAFMMAMAMMAVPARRVPVLMTQPDGTTLSLILEGDECFCFYTNAVTGHKMVREDNGFFRDASDEDIVAAWEDAHRQRSAFDNADSRRKSPAKVAKSGPLGDNVSRFDLTGTRKALVVMVNFSDKQWTFSHDRVDQQMNQEGYNLDGHKGSVHDYFYDQSNGTFNLDIDVVGPVTLSGTASYYGAPKAGANDSHVGEMVREAMTLANAQGIDFSDYDWDGDGEVEMVTCLFAGYGQAQSGDVNTIWPQQWKLTNEGSGAITLDGKKINNYLVLNEMKGSGGDNLDGIGTFIHEFSHSLGLPDIYDSTGKTFGACFGMGEWSVMDYGLYNGDSAVPCNYTAYERAFCGWLNLEELNDENKSITLKPMASSGKAYILYNEGHKDEYYIVYNVNKSGWDAGVPGSGLMVMHVDYVPGVWTGNYVNTNPDHRYCTMICANNDLHSNAGNVYPGTTNNCNLTDETTPAATLFNANYDGSYLMHKALKNIALSGSDITFDFEGWNRPDVQTVVALQPTKVNADGDGFTAIWQPVENEGATYTLELNAYYEYELPKPTPVLSQDFSTDFYIGQSTDGNVWKDMFDGSQNMPGYLSVATKPGGWGFGVIESPKFRITSANVTIKVEMLDIANTNPNIQFLLIDAAGNESKTATIKWSDNLINFTGIASGTYTLRIVEAVNYGAFGLVSIDLYDEAYTLEQLSGSGDSKGYHVYTDVIPGLTTTSYEVLNSSLPAYWTYRVRADVDGVAGEWSNLITVDPRVRPTITVPILVSIILKQNTQEYDLKDTDLDENSRVSIGDVTRLIDQQKE